MLFAACTGLGLLASPAWSQSAIDEDANKILVAMTDNLKGLGDLSADYDADHEIVDKAGQKLQYSASGTMALSRGKGSAPHPQGTLRRCRRSSSTAR